MFDSLSMDKLSGFRLVKSLLNLNKKNRSKIFHLFRVFRSKWCVSASTFCSFSEIARTRMKIEPCWYSGIINILILHQKQKRFLKNIFWFSQNRVFIKSTITIECGARSRNRPRIRKFCQKFYQIGYQLSTELYSKCLFKACEIRVHARVKIETLTITLKFYFENGQSGLKVHLWVVFNKIYECL